MLLPAWYRCAFCGEEIETSLDPGERQGARYVEDCQVCCRPNLLSVVTDPDSGETWLAAEPESDPE